MSDHRDGPAVLVLLSFFAHSFFGCCIPRSFLSTLSFLVIIGISAIFKSCFVYALPIAKNGQIFTNALAIIDAPQMNSVQHAGSNLVLAIDVSGNGKISQAASIPNSGLPYSFQSLNIFLVSTQASLNLTISEGPDFLTQEPGSTVKHLNWPIPKCVPADQYNGESHFTITTYPVSVENTSQNGTCSEGINPLLPTPQTDYAPGISPWLDPSITTFNPSGTESPATATTPYMPGIITVTVGPSGMVAWPLTVIPSGIPTTVYVQPTSRPSASANVVTVTQFLGTTTLLAGMGSAQGEAVTVTVSPTPVTVVFVSVETMISTTTAPGTTQILTSTRTLPMMTTTAMVGPDNAAGSNSFIPINAALPSVRTLFSFWTWFVPFIVASVMLSIL
ncbi:unnamed protein product [Somion occarium]|uniref:Uncharacterized protein n=1 Tax=Somion occarium TaxID=3059160 RepID=A0ABP1CK59_9APHY